MPFPAEFLARAKDPDVAAIIDGERKLFESRRGVRLGQKSQLKERAAQLGEEIQGHLALQKAKAEEIDLIRRELEGVRELWSKNLVQINRLIALEREAARLTGERAQSIFAMAQSRGKISEIELQILQIDQDLCSEVAKELRELDGRFGEFIERKVAAEDQLKRVDIRAPQDGVVHQLAVHTFGEVVTSGNPVMLIVPDADVLSVEARVPPQDIDQLHLGQPAGLRFSGLNQRTTPEINGVVGRISADVSQDQTIRAKLLHGSHQHRCGGDRASGEREVDTRNAGGNLHANPRPHGVVLLHQAAARSGHRALFARGERLTPPRANAESALGGLEFVRYWPKADAAASPVDVCCERSSGRRANAVGWSAFDPSRTSAASDPN